MRKKNIIILVFFGLCIPVMMYKGWMGPINPDYTLRSPDKILDYAYLTILPLINSKTGDVYWNLMILENIQQTYKEIGNYPKALQVQFVYQQKRQGILRTSYASLRGHYSSDFRKINDLLKKDDIKAATAYLEKAGMTRVYTAIQLANYYIDHDQKNKAAEFLSMAYDETLTLDEKWKDYYWDEIAYSLGKLGKISEAYALINQRGDKISLYCKFIPVLAKYGQTAEAFKLLNNFEFDTCKVTAMSDLAVVYHETGQKLDQSQIKVLKSVLQSARNYETNPRH